MSSLRFLLIRLERYSEKCVSERLDPDYARAVTEIKNTLKDCRNELCMKCYKYASKDLDGCDGCRWKI